MFEKIPEELKRDGKFCLWRSEKRDGKTTKVPYRTDGKHCSSTNPDDFAPFGDAVAAWSRGGYDGIGLMVESNISAIDIDHCWKDGKLTPMAQEIVDTMDSYTETSPSGNGLHIIFNAGGFAYGKDRYYINNRNIGLEVYVAGATDRYVTVTGNVVRSRGIEMRGEQLLGIAEKYMRRSSNAKTSVIPPGSCLEDEELIKKAMAASNGDKFRRLFNGDTSGYASASNADLALFSILAYWCGGNTEQMLRIANTSSLRRDKWKREDYIRSTVKKAVDGCREFYKPSAKRPEPAVSSDLSAKRPEATNSSESPFPAEPIPLESVTLPPFPVDALPKDIADYVLAVSESTQTPVDLPAAASIAVLSIGLQKKYVIKPKADWTEPLNTFIGIFMPPSERKSAVCSAMVKPINDYEREWNEAHSAEIDFSASEKNILESKLKAVESQAAKGKADIADVREASKQLSDFREKKPLRYYVDDVTPEKLGSIIAENNGKAAIFTPEGGIFDLLKGMYTRHVNIDVFLKGYSGDSIRVDRIGRGSETVYDPALTVMLMAQPGVLAGVMENENFRGRGLTARFLYSVPESRVGTRKYRSAPISGDVRCRYDRCVRNILQDDPPDPPETILLSKEADMLLEAFAVELEPKLRKEYADISEWAGKLVGNIARIAGLLYRASVRIDRNSMTEAGNLVVSGKIMENAIRIGRYFIEHARMAFSILGADENIRKCKYVLNAISQQDATELSRRDVLRMCRSFKSVEDLQPTLDQLVEYGYLAEKSCEKSSGKGRPASAVYIVNPCVFRTQ